MVLAGGMGLRLGLGTPKQLAAVGGRSILARAVEAFDSVPGIEQILVVMAAGHVAEAERIVKPFAKVARVIEGGESRMDSTRQALAALADLPADTRVLFHDAARPFVPRRVIDDCLAALESAEAVAVVVPSSDTVAVVEGGHVVEIPPRDRLRRFQTPQGFRLGTIREAYRRVGSGFAATDDCGVVHRCLPGTPIAVVAGSERNIKITHPADLLVAERIAVTAPGSDRDSAD